MSTPDIPEQLAMNRAESERYLLERRVPELFQALMTGLVHHRPDDVIQYLLDCMDHVQSIGPDSVLWDSFLELGSSPPLSVNWVPSRPGSLPPLEHVRVGRTLERTADIGNSHEGQGATRLEAPQNEQEAIHAVTNDTPKGDQKQRNDETEQGIGLDELVMAVDVFDDEDRANADNARSKKKKAKEERQRLRKEGKHAQGKINKPAQLRHHAQTKAQASDDEADEKSSADLSRQISEAPKSIATYLGRPRVMDVLQGSLDDLPQLPSNTIRIFLSSTFTDFKAERNILPRLAYPRLQAFCSERGLDFQVVDMRWGVTDEMMNDHQVSELCLKEIKTCQQVSCGPSFVTMIGNKYGYRPYPNKINADEYKLLMTIAEEEQFEGREVVNDWYRVNTNVVPPEYVIQPIASKLKYYNDVSDENKDLRKNDRATWNNITETILAVLRASARQAVKTDKLSETEAEKYFISVTEQEIQEGLLNAPQSDKHALCFRRDLEGVEQNDNTPKRWRFVDTVNNESLDEDAVQMKANLLESKIPSKVKIHNQLKKYTLRWHGVPLEEAELEEYKEYLHRFSDDFVSEMIQHITDGVSLQGDRSEQAYKELYHEALQHARFAQQKCELFCGQDDTMAALQQYVEERADDHGPMIISGKSGYGKTAVIANTARCIQQWLPEDQKNIIMRYLGTSPQSSNVMVLLRSLIHQICALFNWNLPGESHFNKFGETRSYFWTLLERVHTQYPDCKLILLLDSIDQLSPLNGAYKLSWLPKKFAGNIYVVLSMLSDRYSCVEYAQKRFDNAQFHEIQKLSLSSGNDIIKTYMALHKRSLTEEQHDLVLKTFGQVSQPLFLKLVLDETLKWCSYDNISELLLANSVHGAITTLFETLEVTFGQVFVSRALGYLTCGLGGLSSLEMEDVLSCDDDVLNEVYKYHDPPLEGTIRMPSLLWARVQNELQEYLAHRQTDGKTVMTWYHRQFREAAEKRYTEEDFEMRHKILADIYDQENGIKRSILLKQRGMKTMEDADRRVTPQPLKVTNIRKLLCLPYHLFNAHEDSKLLENCLINFDFLQTKLRAIGISKILNEYQDEDLMTRFKGTDLVLIAEFLEISYDSLRFDVNLLAYNIVDRLGSIRTIGPITQSLVESAKQWLKETKTPCLLPTHPLKGLGLDSPLKFAMLAGYDGVLSPNGHTVICNRTDQKQNLFKIVTINLTAKDTLSTLVTSRITPVSITNDSQNFLIIDGHDIEIREAETNDVLRKIAYTKEKYENITPRCIELSSDGKHVAIGVRLGKPRGQSEGAAWSVFSHIALANVTDPNSPVCTVKFPCRKHIESLKFVENDTKLIALASPKICQYAVPSLELLHECADIQGMYGYLLAGVPQKNSFVIPASHSANVRAAVYNYKDNSCTIKSDSMRLEGNEGEAPYAFACQSKDDLSFALIGIAIHTTGTRKSKVYGWNISDNSMQCTELVGGWRTASVMRVLTSWQTAFIGYKNGDLSVFDIDGFKEVYNIHAHGGLLNNIKLYQDESLLLTLAQDHYLKVWDVSRLLIKSKQKTMRSESLELQNTVDDDPTIPNGYLTLDPEEQCLDAVSTSTHAISTPAFNMQCPKYWKLSDGNLDLSVTREQFKLYRDCLEDNNIQFDGRTHGSVMVFGDTMIYLRKKRDAIMAYVSKKQNDQVRTLAKELKNTFFYLFPATEISQSMRSDSSDRICILVRNGLVEICDLEFNVSSSIEVEKITDRVNIESNSGKRKLIYFKIAITIDRKYFIIANPAAGKTTKYMDLIDLEDESTQRVKMHPRTNFKILEDSFYYLVKLKKSSDLEIIGPYQLKGEKNIEYQCLLYTNYTFVSEDLSYGLEYVRSNGIRVWRMSPLKHLHTLHGHEADLSGCAISKDNKFIASGSLDHTVRVWSIASGRQLCVFYVNGAVDNVMFTPDISHIVVHCYAAPQRKRLVVLQLHNVTSQDEKQSADQSALPSNEDKNASDESIQEHCQTEEPHVISNGESNNSQDTAAEENNIQKDVSAENIDQNTESKENTTQSTGDEVTGQNAEAGENLTRNIATDENVAKDTETTENGIQNTETAKNINQNTEEEKVAPNPETLQTGENIHRNTEDENVAT